MTSVADVQLLLGIRAPLDEGRIDLLLVHANTVTPLYPHDPLSVGTEPNGPPPGAPVRSRVTAGRPRAAMPTPPRPPIPRPWPVERPSRARCLRYRLRDVESRQRHRMPMRAASG